MLTKKNTWYINSVYNIEIGRKPADNIIDYHNHERKWAVTDQMGCVWFIVGVWGLYMGVSSRYCTMYCSVRCLYLHLHVLSVSLLNTR